MQPQIDFASMTIDELRVLQGRVLAALSAKVLGDPRDSVKGPILHGAGMPCEVHLIEPAPTCPVCQARKVKVGMMHGETVDVLDIPAFLRKNAD